MPAVAKTVLLLICSNIFMTFAWYAHLKNLSQKPWIVAALVSWGSPCSSTSCRSPPTGSATHS